MGRYRRSRSVWKGSEGGLGLTPSCPCCHIFSIFHVGTPTVPVVGLDIPTGRTKNKRCCPTFLFSFWNHCVEPAHFVYIGTAFLAIQFPEYNHRLTSWHWNSWNHCNSSMAVLECFSPFNLFSMFFSFYAAATIDGGWNQLFAVLLSTPAPPNFNVVFGLRAWVRWTKNQTLSTEEAR